MKLTDSEKILITSTDFVKGKHQREFNIELIEEQKARMDSKAQELIDNNQLKKPQNQGGRNRKKQETTSVLQQHVDLKVKEDLDMDLDNLLIVNEPSRSDGIDDFFGDTKPVNNYGNNNNNNYGNNNSNNNNYGNNNNNNINNNNYGNNNNNNNNNNGNN